MQPLSGARRRAWRALVSVVAGGGLTAAGLSGPMTGAALGSETATGTAGASGAPQEAGMPQPSTQETGAPRSSGQEAGMPQSSTPTTKTTTQPASTTTGPQPATPAPAAPKAPKAPKSPKVLLRRKQQSTSGGKTAPSVTSTKQGASKNAASASGPNNVAASPQIVASQAALDAALATSAASLQALDFYRIPLFLLPIYKAAAVQYGVPWQILAAINEIETDYGSDQSVSTAGAVGWMQFMPATWLQYGVDALDAGYADPYNPVDAIFAAARYLRAAGAATDLSAAILAYNHSQEYVNSVLLRAKLISTYPKDVIATLTGLVDGRLPVTGTQVAWSAIAPSPSSATGNATAVPGEAASGSPAAAGTAAAAGAPAQAGTPGSTAPLTPAGAAAAATAKTAAADPLQFDELTSAANASVVAVQDGRIVRLGHSAQLGKFLVLRDVYGDLFTYAGLGSIAPSYAAPKAPRSQAKSPVVEIASTPDPAPSQPASAGRQPPLTLQVKTPAKKQPAAKKPGGGVAVQAGAGESPPAGAGKIRLFAHPGNPDAVAAAASASARSPRNSAPQRLPLRKGSVVATGTVLGHVRQPPGAQDGHLRFAIRPAGDASTIDPGPILANWAQLDAALHPQGAKAQDPLLGATASDVLLMSKAQLERAVLSDPGITIYACGRQDIAAGRIDRRVLAVLAFLSRSGLKPSVSALRCGQSQYTASGSPTAEHLGDAVDLTAINGLTIAGHQGAGTITDLTIRTLLTLPGEFVPQAITSLMRYPGAPNTHAVATYSSRIHLDFAPAVAAVAPTAAAAAAGAHSARTGAAAPPPVVSTSNLNATQWDQLITQIATLPAPHVARKPTSSAIPDPKHG